jgi:hypothetical protein
LGPQADRGPRQSEQPLGKVRWKLIRKRAADLCTAHPAWRRTVNLQIGRLRRRAYRGSSLLVWRLVPSNDFIRLKRMSRLSTDIVIALGKCPKGLQKRRVIERPDNPRGGVAHARIPMVEQAPQGLQATIVPRRQFIRDKPTLVHQPVLAANVFEGIVELDVVNEGLEQLRFAESRQVISG